MDSSAQSTTTSLQQVQKGPITSTPKKKVYLNKFLSKTYHMIDQCDPDIASWSNGGETFTVKDIDRFETEVLPKYFNHAKFSSFIRQLNFYAFQKQRSDPDLQVHTKTVRFSHEYFRKGQPELLHKIQRTTAKFSASSASTTSDNGVATNSQVEELQHQVEELQHQLTTLQSRMDEKIDDALRSLESMYTIRLRNLEKSYEELLATLLRKYQNQVMAASSPWVTSSQWPPQQSSKLAGLAEYIRSSNHAA